MVPYKDGKANRGHSCVKGRFAWGYATHNERILKPMIRAKITDPWREVSWDEAIAHAASEFKRIQAKYGNGLGRRHHLVALHQRRDLPGAEAGPRRLRQQQRRHLRARLPFADRLWPEHRLSAPRPARRISIRSSTPTSSWSIGANPTDAHPVFASRMKKRLRAGRQADRHRSAPHRPGAHRRTSRRRYHLPLLPGTNVAVLTALAHVIVTEGLVDETFVRERCDWDEFQDWAAFVVAAAATARRRSRRSPACRRRPSAAPRGSTPPAATARSITVSASPSTARARPR